MMRKVLSVAAIGARVSMVRGMTMSTEAINPARTAVVLIEYQNEFASEGGKLFPAVKTVIEHSKMLEKSAKVLKTAREAGCKIMHTPIMFSPDHKEISKTAYGILANVKAGQAFIRGSWGAVFEKSMQPEGDDIVVQGKSGLCGFESTNLQFLLGQNNIDTIVLGGFLTNCCVESTMRAAYEKGYKVITLTDCTAATSPEEQEAATKFTFPMFSIPMTHDVFLSKLKA